MKTTKIFLASTFLVLVSACSGSCSCGSNNDDDGEGGSGGTTTTGTTAGSGGNGTGGDGGGTTAATGGGSGTGGDTGSGGATTGTGGGSTAGYCALGCTEAVDCCGGAPDCPSDVYPYNWSCDEGICVNAGCATNEECTFGGALPTYECFPSPAGGLCLEACEVDEDCTTADFTCTGELDGRTYCTITVEPTPCETDADCGGFGTCQDDGSCSCAGDEECTTDGYVCVE